MSFHLSLALLGLLFSHPNAAAAKPSEEPYRVVILHGANFFLPAAMLQDQALRETLVTESSRRIEFYPEALETFRLPSAEYEPEYVAFLQKKYADIKVDLVLAVSAYAVEFAERHGEALWPQIPVVFYSVSEDLVRHRKLKPGFTGQPIAFDVEGTIDLALRLQPWAKQFVVIGGTAPADQYWIARTAEHLHRYQGKIETLFLTNQPVPQLLAEAKQWDRNSIVLYTSIYRDPTGATYVPLDVLRALTKISGAPVYWFFGTNNIGDGIVGGVLMSFPEQGQRAAQIALRVLAGEKPETIPIPPAPVPVPTVDWRQLQRWGLNQNLLPAGTVIHGRPPSLWSEHKLAVIGTIVVVALQAWMIGGLLLLHARRRQAESELRESELRFRMAADTAPVMLWMSGPDRRCTYFNQRWIDFTGRAVEAEMGDGWMSNVHPEDVGPRITSYYQAFDQRQPFTVEYRLRRHDGQYRWIFAQAMPRMTLSGEFLGYVGSCVDITDRKQMEETNRNLAHVARVSTMGQLASSLAHELNQPLGAILRNAEAGELILQQARPDYEEIRAILTDIRQDDQRAGAVIGRMRSLLKRRNLDFEPLALPELLEQVAGLLRAELLTRHITLEMDLPPNLPQVRGDRVHLQQVLLNLLVNGADALADSTGLRRLEITITWLDAATVELAVHDTGPGIPEARLPNIFDPFFTTKAHGMGMGLAISKTIIEAHGGTLSAENHPAGGAIFRFTLKIVPKGGRP